jgi:hypothetical protein
LRNFDRLYVAKLKAELHMDLYVYVCEECLRQHADLVAQIVEVSQEIGKKGYGKHGHALNNGVDGTKRNYHRKHSRR